MIAEQDVVRIARLTEERREIGLDAQPPLRALHQNEAARELVPILLQDHERVVLRTIVAHQDAKIAVRLLKERIELWAQEAGAVVSGQHDNGGGDHRLACADPGLTRRLGATPCDPWRGYRLIFSSADCQPRPAR